jgi:hypothetical protein
VLAAVTSARIVLSVVAFVALVVWFVSARFRGYVAGLPSWIGYIAGAVVLGSLALFVFAHDGFNQLQLMVNIGTLAAYATTPAAARLLHRRSSGRLWSRVILPLALIVFVEFTAALAVSVALVGRQTPWLFDPLNALVPGGLGLVYWMPTLLPLVAMLHRRQSVDVPAAYGVVAVFFWQPQSMWVSLIAGALILGGLPRNLAARRTSASSGRAEGSR